MFREEGGGAIFIGLKREANPTSNRCGIANLTKSNKNKSIFIRNKIKIKKKKKTWN